MLHRSSWMKTKTQEEDEEEEEMNIDEHESEHHCLNFNTREQRLTHGRVMPIERRTSCNSSKLARLISLSKSTSLCYPSLTPNTARNGLWCNYRGHMLLKGHSDCSFQHSPTFSTLVDRRAELAWLGVDDDDDDYRSELPWWMARNHATRKRRKVFRRGSLSRSLYFIEHRQRSEGTSVTRKGENHPAHGQ